MTNSTAAPIDHRLPVGTRVTLDPQISNLRRTGTVIEPNLATADTHERVRWDNDRSVFRYHRRYLRIATPEGTGYDHPNAEGGVIDLGAALFAVVFALALLFGGWATISLRTYPDPNIEAPECHVVMAGYDDDPEQADSDLNWVAEAVYRIDYRDGGDHGTWVAKDTPEAPWTVLGYSLREDSTVWNDVDCLPRS